MTAVDFAIVIFALSALSAGYRMVAGPSRADRATAADLMMFVLVALLALLGYRSGSGYTLDIVLVAALVGFLSAVSLSRALTRGKR